MALMAATGTTASRPLFPPPDPRERQARRVSPSRVLTGAVKLVSAAA